MHDSDGDSAYGAAHLVCAALLKNEAGLATMHGGRRVTTASYWRSHNYW